MTEAFLRPEQKLFLRVVTVTPRKGGANWLMLATLAVEFLVVVAFWGGLAAFLWSL